jgi:type VI secretion system secreted protein VgrG
VAQTSAGIGWGSIIIPRVGMEAVVTFLEGNPDRPLITGVVYNATNTVPNTLPDKKVLSSMRSNSSKGGGGFNEFTMDDTKGNEAVFFQAQYNYNKKVLNNEVVEITQDTTTTVDKGNRAVTITQGNDTHTISQGNRSVSVTTGTDTLSVKGDRSVTVTTGNDSYTVSTGNRSVKVSTGNDDHTVSTGNRSATISVGNESVTVSVGNYTLECSAGNAKSTTGQAFEVSAGTSIKLSANVSIELSCGPTSLKLDPIAGVTISGPMVKVSADAEMQLSGGGMMALSAGLININ